MTANKALEYAIWVYVLTCPVYVINICLSKLPNSSRRLQDSVANHEIELNC